MIQRTQQRMRQRNRRVQEHLALVQRIARHYAARSMAPIDDLRQVGALGLIRAAELYNTSRGVPFEAYARPHVRGAILHYLRDGLPMVRISRRLQELQHLRLPIRSLDQLDQDLPDPAGLPSELVFNEAGAALTALRSLEPKQRRVVEAVVLRGDSLRTVAVRHSSSAASVHRLLHRALDTLRRQLSPASAAPGC